jgi:MSHA biogenesis protein MshG
MRQGVERGESITANMKRMDLFPGLVIQMVSIGEETGSLDEMVSDIADYYERELNQSVEALTAAIEPLVIVFVAALVLVLALGIFLPMISLMGAMG